MYIFIGGTDRTGNVINNSITITDELQERINSASFNLVGFSPNYFDDVKIFEGFPILSATANSVTLNKKYNLAIQNNIFRSGETLVIAINETDEEQGIISSIDDNSDYIKITFSANFTNTPVAGELVGKKKFAGNIVDIKDRNNDILANLEFDITAIDYTRIFDKKLINDTYEDKDARFMINDFCNLTVNKNETLDQFDYANTTALRAVWIESGDGGNPTLDTSDYRETTGTGVFDWTFSGGTATFSATIPTVDGSSFAGVTSGTPTSGRVGFWHKFSDYTDVANFTLRVGSDSSNYGNFSFTPTSNDWTFYDVKMNTMSITGTPVWTAIDYLAIVVVETGTSSVKIDGIRLLENEFFRHYPHIEDSVIFDDFKISRIKPTEVMQRIADSLAWYWFIDYNKYIWLFPNTTINAPLQINETSDNFRDLSISYDTSRVVNRQVVKGSEETSETTYSQVIEGDGVVREWIMKNKFKNLVVKLNDGSSTDLTEASTNTTTINATAHGLVAGEYIVNRTRSNAVREVLTASANSFTVATVTGQTSGDTFSLFVTQTVGIEGLDDETLFDYMSNFNEKSIKSSSTETTLIAGYFLLFTYNEVVPILVQRTNNVSVALMKSTLGYTDGIFDGQPIVDRSITSRSEATKTAEAVINKYSNVIITATFRTEQEGLEAGQLIRIKDTTSSLRNIDQDFIIQSIRMRQVAWGMNVYDVTCSSLLFGMLELLQQILASNRKIKVDEDEIINNIEDNNETLIIADVLTNDVDGELTTETLIIADSVSTDIVEPPFYWGSIGGGPTEMTWDEFSWS